MWKTVIPVEILSVEEVKEHYARLMFTFQQYFAMSEEKSALAVSIAVGVCPHCWESSHGCQCWNDE
jgi:hypothetical protein